MASTIIELIKVIRERTGAGMMDCKKALEESNLDVEKACDWLREKGIAKAATKASRIAAEGLTCAVTAGHEAAIYEVNCETDFVAKSDDFKNLIKNVGDILVTKKPACLDCAIKAQGQDGVSIENLLTNATVKIGEKLSFRRFEILTKKDDEELASYVHMGGKISVLILLNNGTPELAKGLAMHIAANNPSYISKADIDQETIFHETKVQMEAAKNDEKLAGKPETALVKIIEGKVNKFLSEITLSEQAYLLGEGETVAEALKKAGAAVIKFVRYAVGEGIEKRKDNFAEEVMNQVK